MVPAEGGQGRGGEYVSGGGVSLEVAEMVSDVLLDVDAGGTNFQFVGSSRILFTMDVESLYTSTPHQYDLRALRFFLEQRPELWLLITTLLYLAKLVLTLNNFSFNSSQFLQFLRFHRICSDEANFDKGASEMSTFFLNQGFPSSIVDRALNRVQPISHTSALSLSLPSRNSERVLLVLTYHPTSIHIQKIIRRHFRQLQQEAITGHIFPSPPLSTFHRDISSGTPRSKLPSHPQPHGTFPCNCQRCNTCPFISSLPSIQGSKHTFQVKQHFTCTSQNL
eukprot:g26162.t1